MKRIRLSEYAKLMTVTRQTAYNWYRNDKIPYPVERVSERIILVEVPDDFTGEPVIKSNRGKTVAYCRVSTQKQKDGLTNQRLALLEYANENGIRIDKFVEEIGSGFNEHRTKLKKILQDPDVGTIIVEHRERLARSNFELIQSTLSAQDRNIIVVKNDDIDSDLVTEITEFMVSAAGRIYGKRGAKRVKEQLDRERSSSEKEMKHP